MVNLKGMTENGNRVHLKFETLESPPSAGIWEAFPPPTWFLVELAWIFKIILVTELTWLIWMLY